MAKHRISFNLNDDNPHHAEILEWIDSVQDEGEVYRSRAVSMNIIAALYKHAVTERRRLKTKHLPETDAEATAKRIERKRQKSEKPAVQVKPDSVAGGGEATAEREVKGWSDATVSPQKVSSRLSSMLKNTSFD